MKTFRGVMTQWMGAIAAAVLLAISTPTAMDAQDPRRVRVFLDCQSRGCDRDEFRTEVGWVDWVREAAAADVHIIMTRQGTGGGQQYVFDFVGQGDLAGLDLSLAHDAPATATWDETVGRLTRTLRAGLTPYAARLGYADRLDIQPREAAPAAERTAPADDPWNLWVFTVRAGGEAEGEERESSWEWNASLAANRTSPEWKLEIDAGGWFYNREVELNDGEVFVNRTDDWQVSLLAVNSLTSHWSAGAGFEVNSSTQLNRDLGGRTALALEWNLYPYTEANRRQLLVHYQVGASRVRYDQLTLFERMQETLVDHRLAVIYENRQPWGDVSLAVRYSNLLDDFSKYRLSTGADASIRLLRGLQLDIRGGYDVIRDQVYLAAEELSDEEILVQRRELATGYEYGIELGLRYRFGSIYNNVVNNRFPWIVLDF